MKKILLLACITASIAACNNEPEMAPVVEQQKPQEWDTVTIQYSRYEMGDFTRAATSIADYCTRLDIWITDGSTTTDYHQSTDDSGFGSLSLVLNNQKEYTMYAVAHRCTTAATLTDGVVAFPDDKVTHSFFYSHTFTPTKNMTLDCEMQRIVARFRFQTTDVVPDWCKTMRFTIDNVFDRWNVSTGGVHELNRVSTFNNFNKNQDGTVTFNIYAIVSNTITYHDILIEGLDADGKVRESHTLTDVPLCNDKSTEASGYMFTDAPAAFTFKAEDWSGTIEYNF